VTVIDYTPAMLRTVNPPPGIIIIAGRLNYAQQYLTQPEICLACAHDIEPTELVYLVEDTDDLLWLVHQECLESAIHYAKKDG
jgi:hypothetical protein